MNGIAGWVAVTLALAAGLIGLASGAGAQQPQVAPAPWQMELYRDDCRLVDELNLADRQAINAKSRPFVRQVQRGIRAVYTAADFRRLDVNRPERNLNDGLFGKETQKALRAFCGDFPVLALKADTARWDALFASAQHFDRVSEEDRRDWRAEVTTAAAVAAFAGSDALRLRLAGPFGVVRQLLGNGQDLQTGRASAAVCAPAAALPAAQLAVYRDLLPVLLGRTVSDDGAAAAAFCEAYRVTGSAASAAADTLAALSHYAQLQVIDPQAVATIRDPRFGRWVTAKGDDPLPYHRLLRLAGSVPVVLALLAEYRESGGGSDQPAPDTPPTPDPVDAAEKGLPASCSLTAGARYFELTAEDVKAIAGREKLVEAVSKLAGTQARDVGAAADEVAKAVPGLDQCNRDYVAQVLKSDAETVKTYELVDNGFASGPLFSLPNSARTALQALAKLPPPDTRSALTNQIGQILAEALQQKAETEAGRYAAQAAARAVPVAAKPAPPPAAGNTPASGQDNGGATGGGTTGGGTTASVAAASAAAPTTPAPSPQASQQSAQQQWTLPGTIASDLKANGVPAAAANAIGKLAKQPFDSVEALTKQATLAAAGVLVQQNSAQSDAFAKAVEAQIQTVDGVVLGDKAMTALRTMPALRSIDPKTLAEAAPLEGVSFADHALFERAALDPLNRQAEATTIPADLGDLTLAARKHPRVADKVDPLALTVPADCGCVPWDLLADRDVYGFYPYWTAKAGEAAPPAVDLSLFSRVAYFGARAEFDPRSGDYTIADWADWDPAQEAPDGDGVAGFIEAVHRHNAKADLALILDQWTAIRTDGANKTDLAPLTDAVSARLVPPSGFGTAVWNMVNSLGAVNGFLEAPLDGVTLYFPDMADAVGTGNRADPVAAAAKVAAIARAVRAALPAGTTLNIAFALPIGSTEDLRNADTIWSIRKRITLLYMGLSDLIRAQADQAAPVDLVLVLLNRPTTDTKKLLVRGIQDAFAGEVRRNMLRKTVAVIGPGGLKDIYSDVPVLVDGKRKLQPETMDYGQYDDDLSYFRDNFRGVGFWPMPTAAGADNAAVSALLRQHFWTGDDEAATAPAETAGAGLFGAVAAALAPVGTAVASVIASVAEWVCTHRILVRFIAALLLAGLIVLALLSYFRCAICMGIARKLRIPPIGAAALAGVWALLAIFDPLFAPNVVAWLLALVPLALLYNAAFGYIFRMQRPDDP
ncbi:MAG: hypothetical protein KDC18_05850 [Alphaproteobacteria bacterium]|nr:hypothetical protein [Alphaproteobacteria bacterium]MCB9931654.1 hypothetical protein [Alphaproteobacteria bacterium]